jgi:hypothetical protein
MLAYGSDRVRVADDGRILLQSRLAKRWTPRVEKTLTSAEFPGTAVLWSEAYYEVVRAEQLPAGGVRYTLLPWRDEHAMRLVDQYDAATEEWRIAEHAKAIARERGRMGANLLGMLTGHLPAMVQQALASDVGVLPVRLTLLSTLPMYAVSVSLFLLLVSKLMSYRDTPVWMVLIAGYLFLESTFRFFLVMSQSRPIGTPLGTFAYLLFYALASDRTKLVPPFKVEKGYSAPITDAPEDVALRDAFTLREPLVTLLSAEEQGRAAERFGYDYRKQSYIVAGMILLGSLAGIATSVSSGAVLSGLIATALAIEQVVRIVAFRRGPAPSVLGWLARPFVRKLLDASY